MDSTQRLAEIEARRTRINQLRELGAEAQADALERNHHALEMMALTQDVYSAAKGEGEPPSGYTRASENPQALRDLGTEFSDEKITEMLKPQQAGFRAEIYIPDRSILGKEARPVLVFKGSTGEILDPNQPSGRRESGVEDYAAANLPQSMGLETDYYNRAMDAARDFKRALGENTPFDIAGHSLGGGMASAAGVVTGMRTVTVNPAGLHPETTARYARQHSNVTLHDPKQVVDVYQVEGDLLTDIQQGLPQHRAGHQQLANTVQAVGNMLQTPSLRRAVDEHLVQAISRGSDTSGQTSLPAMRAGLAMLGTAEGRQALITAPPAVGNVREVLPAMMQHNGQLVPRPQATSADDVLGQRLGPVYREIQSVATSAVAGRTMGEGVQWLGHRSADGVDNIGVIATITVRGSTELSAASTRATCPVVLTSARAGGEFAATARFATGEVHAQAQGATARLGAMAHRNQAASAQLISKALPNWLPGSEWAQGRLNAHAKTLRERADGIEERGNQAVTATRERTLASADGLRATGYKLGEDYCRFTDEASQVQLDAGYRAADQATATAHAMGQRIRTVSDRAPDAGAVAGVVAYGTAQVIPSALPSTALRATQVVHAARNSDAAHGFEEALSRHSVEKTALPSLRHHVNGQETAADALIKDAQERAQAESRTQSPLPHNNVPNLRIDHPAHPQADLYYQMRAGVHAVDAQHNRTPDQASDRIAGALAVAARAQGIRHVDAVALSEQRDKMIAVGDTDMTGINRRIASVEISSAVNQTLEETTRQMAAASAEREALEKREALEQQQQAERQQQNQQQMGGMSR